MQRIKLVLITALILAFTIFGTLVYFIGQNLGQSKNLISQVISKAINLELNFESASVDWLKLIQLKPSIGIKNLSIANPPGYNNQNFLQARDLNVELSLFKLLQKRVHISKVNINEASILLEQNGLGNKNLDLIIYELTKKPAPINFKAKSQQKAKQEKIDGFIVDTIELDEFKINKSKISLISYVRSSKFEVFTIDHINVSSKDFSTDKSSNFNVRFSIFDIPFPVLSYKGSIGPVFKESINTQGSLELEIKLKDIPKNSRKQYFGNIIAEPSSDDTIRLEAKIAGDLLKQIKGEGFLSLKEIHSGKSRDKQVELNGLIPVRLSLVNLLTNPKVNLLTEKAKLQLSESSSLELDSNILSTSTKTSIQTTGSIKGSDINKLLSAYTEYENKLYGEFTIPEFSFNLNGIDADEMLTSLDGYGSIRVSNGSLAILEKIFKLKGFLANYAEVQTNMKHESLSRFTSLESAFRIENRKLKNDSLKISSPVLTFYGSGEYSFDNKLNYHLLTKVLAKEVPIYISGTADKPKLNLDTKQFTINEIQKQLQPLADKFFNQFIPKNKEVE